MHDTRCRIPVTGHQHRGNVFILKQYLSECANELLRDFVHRLLIIIPADSRLGMHDARFKTHDAGYPWRHMPQDSCLGISSYRLDVHS